jgi:hypothetical protein
MVAACACVASTWNASIQSVLVGVGQQSARAASATPNGNTGAVHVGRRAEQGKSTLIGGLTVSCRERREIGMGAGGWGGGVRERERESHAEGCVRGCVGAWVAWWWER